MDLQAVEHVIFSPESEFFTARPFFNEDTYLQMKEIAVQAADFEGMSSEERETVNAVLLSVFFGYVHSPEDYSQGAGEFLSRFFPGFGWNEEAIKLIRRSVELFFSSEKPQNQIDRTVADVFLFYIADAGYFTYTHNFKREQVYAGKKYSVREWYENELKFWTERHHFYTRYGKEVLQKTKEHHISEIKKLLGVN